ncbi:MAG: DUF642 domain-containing protein [Treponema sp.]
MDTRTILRKTAAVLLTAALCTGYTAAQTPENKSFTNGGFEQDLTGWKTGTFGSYTKPVISVESGTVPEGSKALKLSASDDNTRGWAEQRFTVQPGMVYVLTASIKAEKVTYNRMGIQVIEYPADSDTALSLDIKKTLPIQIGKNTQDWTLYETAVKTSPQTHTLTVRAYIGTHGPVKKGAAAWVDGLQITEQAAGTALNLLPNAGFEHANTGSSVWYKEREPAQWTLWTAKGAKGVQAGLDTADKHEGAQSVRLQMSSETRLSVHTAAAIDGNKTYRLSAAVKTADITGGVYLRAVYFDANNTQIAGKLPTTHIVRGTTPWTDYSVKLTPPPEAVKIKVECFADNAAGTVWFDSCTLTEETE